MNVNNCHISFMEQGDIQESAKVLSLAMLDNPLHMAVFRGNGENERLKIERMFIELFQNFPGIVFLTKEHNKIVGVMRMPEPLSHSTECSMAMQPPPQGKVAVTYLDSSKYNLLRISPKSQRSIIIKLYSCLKNIVQKYYSRK